MGWEEVGLGKGHGLEEYEFGEGNGLGREVACEGRWVREGVVFGEGDELGMEIGVKWV